MTEPTWRKSSHSTGSGNCVEVRQHADRADVRDTKNRHAGQITFDKADQSDTL